MNFYPFPHVQKNKNKTQAHLFTLVLFTYMFILYPESVSGAIFFYIFPFLIYAIKRHRNSQKFTKSHVSQGQNRHINQGQLQRGVQGFAAEFGNWIESPFCVNIFGKRKYKALLCRHTQN